MAQGRNNFFLRCEKGLRNDPYTFWKFISNSTKGPNNLPAVAFKGKHIVNPAQIYQNSSECFPQLRKHLRMVLILTSRSLVIFTFLILAFLGYLYPRLNFYRRWLNASVGPGSSFNSTFYWERSHLQQKSADGLISRGMESGSHITPISKNEKGNEISNFQPISILNTLAKVFERIVYGYLYSHVRSRISENQHGFMKGRSTMTNLTTLMNTIGPEVEYGGQVDVIYLDFQKAFEKIPIQQLLLTRLVRKSQNPYQFQMPI